MAISIFIWGLTLSACAYLLMMGIITSGWFRLKNFESRTHQAETRVSLVIAMRNEEDNILHLLQHLYRQDYPQHLIEVILVDDHSEDQTKNLVGRFRKENNIRNIILEKMPGTGKKAAITQGVKLASGELIITTDADCEMASNWITRIIDYYREFNPKLMLGPVVYHREKGLFQKFFSIDFIGLVATGAGSLGSGRPMMGNGANMAFNRKVFEEINSTVPGKEFASGDDVFLIHMVAKRFGMDSVHFIKDAGTIVKTMSPDNIFTFFSQRIRWASKAKGYRTSWSVMVPVIVALFNLMLAASFVAGVFTSWFLLIFLLYILLKFLIDLPLLFDFMGFADKRRLRLYALPFQFVYPFYIVIAAFLSLFVRYQWKGRRGLR